VAGSGRHRLQERALPERRGLLRWACFMCEQAAQFILQALLHAAGRSERTHDLTGLWKALDGAGIDLPSALEDALKRLSRHYVMPRYPDVVPGGEPASFYGRGDAEQAIGDASKFIAKVDEAWGARDA
jgi:HEPN domain-containing protein